MIQHFYHFFTKAFKSVTTLKFNNVIESSWADFFRGKVGKARLEDWLRSNQPSTVLKAARFTGRARTENESWGTPTVFEGQKRAFGGR